jgi:dipeptidyl aminopeptidase/acylaminoacyl peptidase
MGTPQANAEAYTAASVLSQAGKIVGKLMLIHGQVG